MRTAAFRKLTDEVKLAGYLIRMKKPLLKLALKQMQTTGYKTHEEYQLWLRIWSNSRTLERQIEALRWGFRHKHIVASLLRGKTREQIERPGSCPADEDLIERLYAHYAKAIIEEEIRKGMKTYVGQTLTPETEMAIKKTLEKVLEGA